MYIIHDVSCGSNTLQLLNVSFLMFWHFFRYFSDRTTEKLGNIDFKLYMFVLSIFTIIHFIIHLKTHLCTHRNTSFFSFCVEAQAMYKRKTRVNTFVTNQNCWETIIHSSPTFEILKACKKLGLFETVVKMCQGKCP